MKNANRLYQMLVIFAVGLSLGQSPEVWAVEEGVRNVRFQVRGQKIHVSYDLAGKGVYTVNLRLLDGGRTLVARPRSVSGDVGKEVRSGKEKKIVWDALKDVARLGGDDFVFEVRAVRPGGTSKWVWIGGAGIAAGGAAGAVLLQGEEKKGTIVIDVPDPEE